MKQLYQTIDGRLFENSFEAEHHEEQLKNFPKTDKEIVEHNLAICLSNISRLKSFLLKDAEDRLATCWVLLEQSLPHKKADMLYVVGESPGTCGFLTAKYGFLTAKSEFISRVNAAVEAARSLKKRMSILKMSKTMSKKYNEMLKKLRSNPEEHVPTELLKTPEEV